MSETLQKPTAEEDVLSYLENYQSIGVVKRSFGWLTKWEIPLIALYGISFSIFMFFSAVNIASSIPRGAGAFLSFLAVFVGLLGGFYYSVNCIETFINKRKLAPTSLKENCYNKMLGWWGHEACKKYAPLFKSQLSKDYFEKLISKLELLGEEKKVDQSDKVLIDKILGKDRQDIVVISEHLEILPKPEQVDAADPRQIEIQR